MAVNPNDHDVFLLRQRIKLVINQYEFFLPGGAETPGVPESTRDEICFVEQKRFKFKEDIRFYTDESKTTREILRIKARQRFDPRATYDVTDELGGKIGSIQKVFGKSLLRSTYRINGANDEELCIVTEKSLPVALFRRAVGFIPYVDAISDWLPIPYHFIFKRAEEVIGTNSRQAWKIRDVYTIDMTADPQKTIDRRLVLAMAVGQDALQAR